MKFAAVQSVLRKHWLVAGLLLVSVALLGILWLQYRSLSTLQTTLPSYSQDVAGRRLLTLSRDIQRFYQDLGTTTLSIPASAFPKKQSPSFEAASVDLFADSLVDVAAFLKRQDSPAIERLFVVASVRTQERTVTAAFTLDPLAGKMRVETDPSYRSAMFPASAPYIMYIRDGVTIDGTLVSVDANRGRRLLLKPVLEPDGRGIAVAGLVIRENYFLDHYLPGRAGAWLAESFPGDREATLVVRTRDDKIVFQSRAVDAEATEVSLPMEFVFNGWSLGLAGLTTSGKAWATRYLTFMIAAAILSGLMLSAGLAVAFRTAVHEARLSNLKSDFLSNMSHELRTPLASIRVFGELIGSGRVTDLMKTREYGNRIEAESRKLDRLIDRILDFSKSESGSVSYQFEPLDLRGLVQSAIEDCRSLPIASHFEINFTVEPHSPCVVSADRSALTQAMMNLIENAMKYSAERGRVSVSLRASDRGFAIAVQDWGVGIPEDQIPRIFDRFHRIGNSLTHDVKGSGLGLAIVQRVVEAHGGTVSVRSKTGAASGTTFTVELPRANAQDAPHSESVPDRDGIAKP